MSIDGQLPSPGKASPFWKRLGWFVALWCGGVLVVSAVAWTIRFWIG